MKYFNCSNIPVISWTRSVWGMCHFDKCSLKHKPLFITQPVFSFFTVVDQGPFSVVLLCSQDEQCNIKRALADKKRGKKEK